MRYFLSLHDCKQLLVWYANRAQIDQWALLKSRSIFKTTFLNLQSAKNCFCTCCFWVLQAKISMLVFSTRVQSFPFNFPLPFPYSYALRRHQIITKEKRLVTWTKQYCWIMPTVLYTWFLTLLKIVSLVSWLWGGKQAGHLRKLIAKTGFTFWQELLSRLHEITQRAIHVNLTLSTSHQSVVLSMFSVMIDTCILQSDFSLRFVERLRS